MSFSIIIPTIGRKNLVQTLASLQGQLERGDRVYVVSDDEHELVGLAWKQAELPGKHLVMGGPRAGGSACRTFGMRVSHGSHLLFMDDDDEYLPGALDIVREAIRLHLGRVHIFRMFDAAQNLTLWATRKVEFGNVGTPMFCVPNRPQQLGRWGTPPGADYQFLVSTLGLYPEDSVIWHEDVIATVWPARFPRSKGALKAL